MKKYAYFDFAYTICPYQFVSGFNLAFVKDVRTDKLDYVTSQYEVINKAELDGSMPYNEIVNLVNKIFSELITGQTYDFVSEYAEKTFKDIKPFAYVKLLFEYLFANDYKIVIVTADNEFMIRSILNKLPQGFDLHCSKMEVVNGKFTGKIELLLNSKFKLDKIKEIEKDGDVFTIAFGDSQGDIPMLENADLGFFINTNEQIFKEQVHKDTIFHISNPDDQAAFDTITTYLKH